MNQDTHFDRRAISNEVLFTHMGYLERDLDKVLAALPNMATKQDIKNLEDRMTTFATKDELRVLERKISVDGVHGTLNRWANTALKFSAVVAAIGSLLGAGVALVHFWDKIK